MPTKTSEALVLTSKQNGIVVIPMGTELTRLNYFDGKFLRASDLKAEQDYLRHLVQESNRASGSGVAHGFDVTRGDGDTLNIGPGLAIDVEGRVLLMPQAVNIGIQDLINKSLDAEKLFGDSAKGANFAECEIKSETPPDKTTHPNDIYKIVICAAEALCGEEDVYGKLCEEACATSTDRPLIIEGVAIRAVPLGVSPTTKGELTQTTLRSRTAAAYFEDERRRISSLISGEGLKSQTWCRGATAATDGCVPIAVVARAGKTTVFLDPWIVRRELMDTQARRYWQWRMMMRPWDVFLAQILQFQCQLRDLTGQDGVPGGDTDPCGGAREALLKAREVISGLSRYYGEKPQDLYDMGRRNFGVTGEVRELNELSLHLDTVYKGLSTGVTTNRWLINGGIIELPSAGYLPVVPGVNNTINKQVRQMMGEGVDLRFCIVRPDYVAHALEEAQHMERISLIEGLEDAQQKPEVDILVPDGEIIEGSTVDRGGFEASIQILTNYVNDIVEIVSPTWTEQLAAILDTIEEQNLSFTFNGAARRETLANSHSFYAAMLMDDSVLQQILGSIIGRTAVAMAMGAANPAPTSDAKDAKTAEAEVPINEVREAMKNSRLFSRFKTRAAQRFVEQEASPEGMPAKVPQRVAVSSNKPPFSQTEPLVPAGLWIEANCNQDLRKIDENIPLRITARVTLGGTIPGRTGGQRAYLDLHTLEIDTFNLQTWTEMDGSKALSCGASVFGAVIANYGDHKESDSRLANVEVEVGWSSTAAGTHITVSVKDPDSKLEFVFRGDFAASSGELLGNIKTGIKDDFNVGLRPNADVFKVDNDEHLRALKAVDIIGTALKSPNFSTKASTQLFPPAAQPDAELVVRGTRDWVLFHRRRNKTCSIATPPPPPPPPPPAVKSVCHSVYEARSQQTYVTATQQMDRIIQSKQGNIENDVIKELGLLYLGDVLFEENTAKVFSNGKSLDLVVSNWQGPRNVGGCSAYFAPVGKQAGLQADKIAQEIDNGSSPISIESTEVPTGISMPTSCPVFSIMVAKDAAVPATHTVYKARNQDQFEKAVKGIQGMTGGSIQSQIVAPNELINLGDVQFEEHTATVFGDGQSLKDVAIAWKKEGGGPVSRIATFHPLAQQSETSHGNQAKAVVKNLTGSDIAAGNASVSNVSPGANMPTAAPAFSIMVEGQSTPVTTERRYRVFELTQETLQKATAIKFDPNAFLHDPNGWDIPAAMPPAVWKLFEEIAVVSFAQSGSTLVGDTSTLVSNWKTSSSGSIVRGGIFSQGDAANDGSSLLSNRIEAVEFAVVSKTKTDGNARADIMNAAPPLNLSGVDGVIVLLNGKFIPPPQPYGTAYGGNAIGGNF